MLAMRRAILLESTLIVGATLVAGPLHAQSNSALAESLFREGKKLLEAKRFDEACPKFVESARLDLSSGVELALGLCLEGQGKFASAWGAYLSAANLAHHDGRPDRENAAKARANALEPKLSHVTFDVVPATSGLAGLELRQDGVVIGSPAWINAPVDPGPHKLEVTAPGKKPFSRSYSVGAIGDSVTVHVPALEDAPLPPAPEEVVSVVVPEHHAPEPQTGKWVKPFGFVLGGTGIAALGVGTALGIITLNDASQVHGICPTTSTNTCASGQARSENQTAQTLANVSTGLFIGGGVAVATGLILVLASPRSKEGASKSAWVRPALSPTFAGVSGGF